HGDLGPRDLRKAAAERLRDVERQRLDQETAPAGDDLLDLREGNAVVDGGLDRIRLEVGVGPNVEHRIDIETLAERLLLVEHAMAGKERAVLHADDIVRHCGFLPDQSCRAADSPRWSIASAKRRASTLIATSW